MKKIVFVSLILFSIGSICQVFAEENIFSKELDNGLFVVIQEHPAAPFVSINISVKSGFLQEAEYAGTGMVSLVGNLVSSGATHKRSKAEMDKAIRKIGGDKESYPDWNHIYYFLDTTPEYFEDAVELISDYIQNTVIDENRLEKEKAATENELSLFEELPWLASTDLFNKTAFVNDIYKNSMFGYKHLLQALTLDDVRTSSGAPVRSTHCWKKSFNDFPETCSKTRLTLLKDAILKRYSL